jgi:hypothetical protein
MEESVEFHVPASLLPRKNAGTSGFRDQVGPKVDLEGVDK